MCTPHVHIPCAHPMCTPHVHTCAGSHWLSLTLAGSTQLRDARFLRPHYRRYVHNIQPHPPLPWKHAVPHPVRYLSWLARALLRAARHLLERNSLSQRHGPHQRFISTAKKICFVGEVFQYDPTSRRLTEDSISEEILDNMYKKGFLNKEDNEKKLNLNDDSRSGGIPPCTR